jgi:hypothetical protein
MQFGGRMAAAMVAELLAVGRLGSKAVDLPRLAHLASRAPVPRAMAFMVHGETSTFKPDELADSFAGAFDGVATTNLPLPFPEIALPEGTKMLRPFLRRGQLANMDVRHGATRPS